MNSYEASFEYTHCYIEVEPRPGPNGPTFVALPFVIDDEKQVLYWIPDDNGGRLEFHDETEAGALNSASTFLVGRYGHQTGPFRPAAERTSPRSEPHPHLK